MFLLRAQAHADSVFRPSLLHMGKGFEAWASRKHLLQLVRRLEKEALLEKLPGNSRDRLYRITPAGIKNLWLKDPETQWNTPWDGLWRLLVFDLPQENVSERKKLTRALRERGFGCLQGSVWVSPHALEDLAKKLRKGERFASSLLCLEGKPAAWETPEDIVLGAWNWDEIIRLWQQFRDVLETCPTPGAKRGHRESLNTWLNRLMKCWNSLALADPFLPKNLFPSNYPGPRIWNQRIKIFSRLPKLPGWD
jgi:phenylacetic acid degradation operon negative regulatory protein